MADRHLATLGVVEIDRFAYLEQVPAALRLDPPRWHTGPVEGTLRHVDPETD